MCMHKRAPKEDGHSYSKNGASATPASSFRLLQNLSQQGGVHGGSLFWGVPNPLVTMLSFMLSFQYRLNDLFTKKASP